VTKILTELISYAVMIIVTSAFFMIREITIVVNYKGDLKDSLVVRDYISFSKTVLES
jgi:hypothetical protein